MNNEDLVGKFNDNRAQEKAQREDEMKIVEKLKAQQRTTAWQLSTFKLLHEFLKKPLLCKCALLTSIYITYAQMVYLWGLFVRNHMSSIDDRQVLFFWETICAGSLLAIVPVALLLLYRTKHQKFDIIFAAECFCCSIPRCVLLTLEMRCISRCIWYQGEPIEIMKLCATTLGYISAGSFSVAIWRQCVPVLLSRTEKRIAFLRKVETTLSEGRIEIERRHNFVYTVTALKEILPTDLAQFQMDFLPEYSRFCTIRKNGNGNISQHWTHMLTWSLFALYPSNHHKPATLVWGYFREIWSRKTIHSQPFQVHVMWVIHTNRQPPHLKVIDEDFYLVGVESTLIIPILLRWRHL